MRFVLPMILLAASSAFADAVTLTMDEVGQQGINGLVVTKGGIDFTFSDTTQNPSPLPTLYPNFGLSPNLDAACPATGYCYNAYIPGQEAYITDPAVAGPTEPFGVTFSVPVYSVDFGIAEALGATTTGVDVTLYDGSNEVFSTNFDLIPDQFPAPEYQFTWNGAGVTSLQVTPDSGYAITGFDNLSVDTTPEPSSLSLLAIAITSGLLIFRRRLAR